MKQFLLALALALTFTPSALAGVSNGQAVNAANTNAAFMDKNTSATFTTAIADIRGGIETKSAVDSTSTGALQNVTLVAPITIYTNVSLSSIQNITLANRADASLITVRNNTGGVLTLKNLSGGTASLQINTAIGADLALPSGAAANMYYDTVNTKWQVVSLAGSDVSASNITVGSLSIPHGGTGQTTRTLALDALLPTQNLGNLGQALTANNGGGVGWSILQSAGGGTGLASPVAHSLIITNGASAYNTITGGGGTLLNGIASSDPAFTLTPTLGVNATSDGVLNIATSVGSGQSISIKNGGATSAYNFILPTTAGTTGQTLISQGGGSTAMTWGAGGGTVAQNVTTQTLLNGTTSYYLTYVFTVTSANATAAATYTNNSKTCTVEATIAAQTTLLAFCTGDPLASGTLTKSTGSGDSTITFSAWVKPVRLEIIGVGGGGGSSSSGTGSSGSAASSNGGNTTFGSILTATGGGKGTAYLTQAPSAGGTCTSGDWGVQGGNGAPPRINTSSLGTVDAPLSGTGGGTFLAPSTPPGENQGGGSQSCIGYGSGGGPPGLINGASNTLMGSPGAGGGTCFLNVAASSLAYPVTVAIGAGTAGASAGTSGQAGGSGCNGVLIVKEHYNY